MTANDNEAPVPPRFSDQAALAFGLLNLAVGESIVHPAELDDIVTAVFLREEFQRLSDGLERLACDLWDAGL